METIAAAATPTGSGIDLASLLLGAVLAGVVSFLVGIAVYRWSMKTEFGRRALDELVSVVETAGIYASESVKGMWRDEIGWVRVRVDRGMDWSSVALDLIARYQKNIRRVPSRFSSPEFRTRVLHLISVIADPYQLIEEQNLSPPQDLEVGTKRAVEWVKYEVGNLVHYLERPLRGKSRRWDLPELWVWPDPPEPEEE